MAIPKKIELQTKFWRKLSLQTLLVLIVFGALAAAGYKAYKIWQISSLTAQARAHLKKNDPRSAFLAARRAVDFSPSSIEATKLAAEALDSAGVPESIGWYRRVSEMNQGSAHEALAWARCAIQYGDFSNARMALDAVPGDQRDTANYQQLAGGTAVGLGKPLEAGPFYARAAALDPGNELHQFNHARWVLELDSDKAHRLTAVAAMQKLTASPRYSTHAHRALASQQIRDGKWAEALAESTAVHASDSVTFSDRILHLNLLKKLSSPALESFLGTAQSAAKTSLDVLAVIHWMQTHDRPAAAIAWASKLEAKLVANTDIRVALADCFDSLKDWKGLFALTSKTDWKEKEALRFAFLSRAQRQLGDIIGAGNHWTAASVGALKSKPALDAVLLRTIRWEWREETRQLLWGATKTPNARWALATLHKLYQEEHDTDGLLRVASNALDINPTDDESRNNFAALCLLLNRDISTASNTAAQLVEKYPSNPVILSTRAFALHKMGKSAEALRLLEKLKPAQLRHPAIALYYGLLLSSSGRPEAREYLSIAEKSDLLPQERALLDEALKMAR